MLTLKDLARPRGSYLPAAGAYDHELQQRRGSDGLLMTSTGDEDEGSSTTFWDGERQ